MRDYDAQLLESVAVRRRPGPAVGAHLPLAYEPPDPNTNRGQTGIAISYGNPVLAASTGVIVPGTTNNAGTLGGLGGDARDLYNTMSRRSKAVVVWLNGPEPQSVARGAPWDSWANDSSPNLVSDANGLRAAHTAATGDAGHRTRPSKASRSKTSAAISTIMPGIRT